MSFKLYTVLYEIWRDYYLHVCNRGLKSEYSLGPVTAPFGGHTCSQSTQWRHVESVPVIRAVLLIPSNPPPISSSGGDLLSKQKPQRHPQPASSRSGWSIPGHPAALFHSLQGSELWAQDVLPSVRQKITWYRLPFCWGGGNEEILCL